PRSPPSFPTRRSSDLPANPRKGRPAHLAGGRLTHRSRSGFLVQADLLLVERAVGMEPLWGFRVRDRLEFEGHAMNFTPPGGLTRSEEHTSELQSPDHL